MLLGTACTTPGPSMKVWDADDGESLSIDAKQRIVTNTATGGPDHNQRVICAEPSPDVFIAVDTGTDVDANVSGIPSTPAKIDIAGKLNRAINESSAGLTNRTQAIQLLRDSLYRACEAYSNGAIGSDEYRRILVSYDDVLVVLVALSAVNAPDQVALPTLGTGSDSTEVLLDTSANPEDPEKTKMVRNIVRDYYCFQFGVKNITVNQDVVDSMCGHNEIK